MKKPPWKRGPGSLESEDGGNRSFVSTKGKDLESEVLGQKAGLAKVEWGGGGLGSSSDDGITMGVGGWCLPESFAQPWGTVLCLKGRAQSRLMVPKYGP